MHSVGEQRLRYPNSGRDVIFSAFVGNGGYVLLHLLFLGLPLPI